MKTKIEHPNTRKVNELARALESIWKIPVTVGLKIDGTLVIAVNKVTMTIPHPNTAT
jgi:hypothetical protein